MSEKIELSYCSWCGAWSRHHQIEQNYLRRNVYRCTQCHEKTVQCRFCKNMARTGEKWDDELCSEHDGSISAFKNLNLKIDDLSDFKQLFERDTFNLMRVGKIAAGTIAGVAVVTPFAFAAAPALASSLGAAGLLGAAGTGTAISTLSGAALTSASMAAIGGGTMLGGLVVVTAAGAALGAYKGGIVSNSYFGEIDHFEIRKVHHGKKGNKHALIFINGFMSEMKRDVEDWTTHLGDHFDENSWYHVDWESHNLHKLGKQLKKAPDTVGVAMAKQLAERATKNGAKKLGPLALVNTLSELVGNPWHSTMVKAGMTGVLLADAIARTQGWTFTLAGHSLGARAIFYTLEALSTRNDAPVIEDVYLLGGAVGGGEKDNDGWEAATHAVRGRIFNCHSDKDDVLKYMYQGANCGLSAPIGFHPICFNHSKIYNVDCTDLVGGHMEWKNAFSSILKRVGVRNQTVST